MNPRLPIGRRALGLHFPCLALSLAALLPAAHAQKLTNPFFAFDNGTGRDLKVPLEEQAELVKRTGYAGLGYTGALKVPEMLKALESRGLKMFSTYVAVRVDGDKPSYDAALPEAFRCWHYVLAQTAETRWDFHYVADETAHGGIEAAVASVLGDGARVNAFRRKTVSPAASGKFALLKPLIR